MLLSLSISALGLDCIKLLSMRPDSQEDYTPRPSLRALLHPNVSWPQRGKYDYFLGRVTQKLPKGPLAPPYSTKIYLDERVILYGLQVLRNSKQQITLYR